MAKKLGLELNKGGTIRVDPWTLQTSLPKVYAGGDVVTGASNVSDAMGFGKKAAAAIDRQLTGEDRFRQLWPRPAYDNSIPPHAQGGSRHAGKLAACAARRANFHEAVQPLSAWEAKAEALRCLRCDLKADLEDESGNHSHQHNLQPAAKP